MNRIYIELGSFREISRMMEDDGRPEAAETWREAIRGIDCTLTEVATDIVFGDGPINPQDN